MRRIFVLIAAVASSGLACGSGAPHRAFDASRRDEGVRNVILFVGDGMGVTHVAAASQLRGGTGRSLAMESMPVTGLMKHHCADRLVTDSAASASAIATGRKSPYRMISQTRDGAPLRTIAQSAIADGRAVGVITSTFLFDATGAAFLAHAGNRREYARILDQMLMSGAHVLIGGDGGLLLDGAPRSKDLSSEDREFFSQVPQRAARLGWTVALDQDPARVALPPDDRLLALYPVRPGRSPDVFGPRLRESLRLALPRLDADEDGFFLLVESEDIDEGAHANDFTRTMDGVLELDDALSVALAFARSRNDTLVIVTADHETGGLTIAGRSDDGTLDARWSTGGHSIEWVPIFAEGPGAERFAGVRDNTEIATILADLLGLAGVGDVIE